MVKKMSGGKQLKTDTYIRKILLGYSSIYKYEALLSMRAFIKTVRYFIDNAIEFSISDAFKFVKYKNVEREAYLRYRDERCVIPEHLSMRIEIEKKLRDYLNSRGEFENAKHREKLPDGEVRKNDLF